MTDNSPTKAPLEEDVSQHETDTSLLLPSVSHSEKTTPDLFANDVSSVSADVNPTDQSKMPDTASYSTVRSAYGSQWQPVVTTPLASPALEDTSDSVNDLRPLEEEIIVSKPGVATAASCSNEDANRLKNEEGTDEENEEDASLNQGNSGGGRKTLRQVTEGTGFLLQMLLQQQQGDVASSNSSTGTKANVEQASEDQNVEEIQAEEPRSNQHNCSGGRQTLRQVTEGTGFLLQMLLQQQNSDADSASASTSNSTKADTVAGTAETAHASNHSTNYSDGHASAQSYKARKRPNRHRPNANESNKARDMIPPPKRPTISLGTKPEIRHVDYSFGSQPTLLQTVTAEYVGSAQFQNNFTKGCQWSPCGQYLLTNSEDRCVRVFRLNEEVVQKGIDASKNSSTIAPPSSLPVSSIELDNTSSLKDGDESSSADCLQCCLRRLHGDLVYDYCWYPLLRANNDDEAENQALFATSARDQPVHLWSASDGGGQPVATYRPVNHLDELASAHSLCFSVDGARLYTGYNKMIRVFDVARPGRHFTTVSTSVKHMMQGQSGIVSCIAVNPAMPGSYAAASYARSIGFYSDYTNSLDMMFKAHSSGVTSLRFSADGRRLFSAARKDDDIMCWDIRNPGKTLFTVQRPHTTNQRLYFDIDSSDRHLVSGDAQGKVNVWSGLESLNDLAPPTAVFSAHRSLVNGVSLHGRLPLLATSSGQRVFPPPTALIGRSDSESDDSDDIIDVDYATMRHTADRLDNCVRLWALAV